MTELDFSPDSQPTKKKPKSKFGPKPLNYENLDEKLRSFKLIKQARNKRNRKSKTKKEELISVPASTIFTDTERFISSDALLVLNSENSSNSSNAPEETEKQNRGIILDGPFITYNR